MSNSTVKPANGKLGVLVVGLGAVTSTFMTGVLMARKGLTKPVGSMTQYDKIRVGKGADKKYLKYDEIVPMASLDDIVFGAWDVYPANAYQSAIYAEVLQEKDIEPVKDELEQIVPMKAAFDHNYAKRLNGDNVMTGKTRWEMVEQLREDIRNFKKEKGVERVVVLWAASTEVYVPIDMQYHGTLELSSQVLTACPGSGRTPWSASPVPLDSSCPTWADRSLKRSAPLSGPALSGSRESPSNPKPPAPLRLPQPPFPDRQPALSPGCPEGSPGSFGQHGVHPDLALILLRLIFL